MRSVQNKVGQTPGKLRSAWIRISWCIFSGYLLSAQTSAVVTANILAGGETDLPADTPSGRLDTEGTFSFVGALAISSGGGNYKGSAVALSREWVLTAGHNADLNDDGLPDALWSSTFNLPGCGSFGVPQALTHPGFTGFANPTVNDDLALLRLATPLLMRRRKRSVSDDRVDRVGSQLGAAR